MMTNRYKKLGFTLIELVIVIMVLGILAALAMPKLQGIDSDAKLAATKGARGALQSSAEISYGKNQGFVTLASVYANTVMDDSLVSFAPATCTGAGVADSLISAYYNGNFMLSFVIDKTLCSG